jgi:hypothetical protein
MLLVSSTLDPDGPDPRAVAEVRWFLVNYGLFVTVSFVLAAVYGLVLMATDGGVIPGWDGSPVVQILGNALLVTFFYPVLLGFPPFVAALLVWRLAIRLVGHPRPTAYLLAVGLIAAVGFLAQPTEVLDVVPSIAIVAVAFATAARVPPRPPWPTRTDR